MRSAGDRYTCSDSSCGCEVEIRNPGHAQSNSGAGPDVPDQESLDPGSLRRAEAQATSTQGDFGSQGATGEGTFGTSGSGESAMMSGRYGSRITHNETSTPSERTVAGSSANEHFSCFCGKPMRRTGLGEQTPSSRTATA